MDGVVGETHVVCACDVDAGAEIACTIVAVFVVAYNIIMEIVVTIAGGWQEDGVAVLQAGYRVAVDGVAERVGAAGPCPRAVVGVHKL